MIFRRLRKTVKRFTPRFVLPIFRKIDYLVGYVIAGTLLFPPSYFYNKKMIERATKGSISYQKHQYGYKHRYVKEIIKVINPKSVVDFGCAAGLHLYFFKEEGVDRVLGFEGSSDVLKAKTLISKDFIRVFDLRKPLTLPDKKYDLAYSIEVIEHIHPRFEDIFLKNMTYYSDKILLQGDDGEGLGGSGTGEYNYRKPSYWVSKMNNYGFLLDKEMTSEIHFKGLSSRCQIFVKRIMNY